MNLKQKQKTFMFGLKYRSKILNKSFKQVRDMFDSKRLNPCPCCGQTCYWPEKNHTAGKE